MVNEVTESTILQNTYKSVYTLIESKKITNSYVLGGFPNGDAQFPCYIIQPAQTRSNLVGYETWDYDINIEIELWSKGNQYKIKIDEMKDNIISTILGNLTTIHAQNLILAENWFDDTNVETVELNGLKYHTGSIMLYFKIK